MYLPDNAAQHGSQHADFISKSLTGHDFSFYKSVAGSSSSNALRLVLWSAGHSINRQQRISLARFPARVLSGGAWLTLPWQLNEQITSSYSLPCFCRIPQRCFHPFPQKCRSFAKKKGRGPALRILSCDRPFRGAHASFPGSWENWRNLVKLIRVAYLDTSSDFPSSRSTGQKTK